MNATSRIVADASSHMVMQFCEAILRDYHPRNFAIELWDGTRLPPENGQFREVLWKINTPDVLKKLIASPDELSLAEAYISGECDVEGDMESIFPLINFLLNKSWSVGEKLRLANMALKQLSHGMKRVHLQGKLHSKDRDRKAVRHHYDLSNEFYRLWLDDEMIYSSAYFINSSDDLNTAQQQRMEHICRQLQLQSGERLLDIGCGWGGLDIYAARKYGVRTMGITLSSRQQQFAEARMQGLGLSDQCQVRLMDYRDLSESGVFDKVVSVGMVEHVGMSKLTEYFQIASRVLKPGGTFLLSCIGRPSYYPVSNKTTFVDAYVFPDGELGPVSTMLREAENAGFEVQEVRNLREHYLLTLRHWVNRLESHAAEARSLVGDSNYRIWRLYMAGSVYNFKTSRLGVYEIVLPKAPADAQKA